nr:oxygenase MpaB family protein [Kibdelosporangium sp. MJ126-NF4]CEL19877.1 FIG00816166: hypothetical protein [Kibdelosporangium sp. MJ126-NF4]CTQ97101.1 FIG00816166: hypothetical protein [Kibdelosporangium sp. MJ126-NF4]
MDGLNRRRMMVVGAGGALGLVASGQPWAWAASGSVASTGTGADPRWVWDEEADPVVAAVLERGDVPKVNTLLRTWTRNDQPVPSGLPSDLRDFMEQARRLPPWADQSKTDTAAEFHKVRMFYIGVLGGPGSGMLSTAIPKEARAVYYSKGGANMNDRVAKTSLLGAAVASLNAFKPDGQFVPNSVKTRLVHAAVRHLLPQSPHWSQSSGEQIPISQHDMLVTWHSTATYARRKLGEWQIPMPRAHSDAFLHVWQLTGHMLGIRDEYMPGSWETAFTQYDEVMPPAMGPTREGVELTDILLNMLSEQTSPGRINRPMVNALARYLVGDQVADWDRIPREPFWDPVVSSAWPKLVAFREKLIPLPLVPEIAWVIDELFRRYILLYLTKGKQTDIDIPEINRPN